MAARGCRLERHEVELLAAVEECYIPCDLLTAAVSPQTEAAKNERLSNNGCQTFELRSPTEDQRSDQMPRMLRGIL